MSMLCNIKFVRGFLSFWFSWRSGEPPRAVILMLKLLLFESLFLFLVLHEPERVEPG